MLPVVSQLLSPQGVIAATAEPKVEGVALTAEDFDDALNNGLGGGSRAAGEFVVIRDYAEVLDAVAQVIARLDARPRQVLIEAVILRARLDETNALGIDFNALAGIDFRTVASTSVGGTNLLTGPVPSGKFDKELGAIETDVSGEIPPGGCAGSVDATSGVSCGTRIRTAWKETVLMWVPSPTRFGLSRLQPLPGFNTAGGPSQWSNGSASSTVCIFATSSSNRTMTSIRCR